MGASGSGKTTFLNALCDWLSKSKKNVLSGTVSINNKLFVNQKTFGNYGAYVMQDDVLF